MTRFDPVIARAALAGLPDETSYGGTPALKDVYLPPSHRKAMALDNAIVTGMRGAGKTFWWSALQQPAVRRLIDLSSVRSALNERTEVRTGFGFMAKPNDYPGAQVFPGLIHEFDPAAVWRTVLARQLAPDGHPLERAAEWPARVAWVAAEPERVDRLFFERDDELEKKDSHSLILFDALDRCANDWKDVYRAVRGLLQNALEMRAYRRLRVKIFLRTDQMDTSRIGDFPDASKMLSSAFELSWPRRELYGLLWQYLSNGEHGAMFREFLGGDWKPVDSDGEETFQVPRKLAMDEEKQRKQFHGLSGPWMGTNPRRGFPYSWIPTHLGDTEGRASPRSFIAALRVAAEDTDERRPDHNYALHYESIKRGVQESSKIRVNEIGEDYPWMHALLDPLSGISVPCEFRDVYRRWRQKGVLDRLGEKVENDEVKMPPRRLEFGEYGVREDLEAAGIFQRLLDGRVNIPDIFRVGYGLGGRGGVKSVR